MFGVKNLQVITFAHLGEKQRVGGGLLNQNYFRGIFQIDPSRRFTRVAVDIRTGQLIDFNNARVGHGSTVNLTATIRPIDKTTFDFLVNREWLNIDGDRLYTSTVERVRMLYSFSSKSLVRLIGQYVKTDRNTDLYNFRVAKHSGSFLGSVLYSYKLNWQTVLFVGYGDDRIVTENNDLFRTDRSLFFKVSYAYQR